MRCQKCNFPVLPKFDKCPKCGTQLKEAPPTSRPAADFDFDSPASRPAAKDFDFDTPASASSVSKAPQPVDGVSIISGKAVWSLGPGQIARRVTEREMADCGAVKGIVVQDGVTAAVFADGKLVQTLDGGIYRFSNETVVSQGKTEVLKPRIAGTPRPKEEPTPEAKEEKKPGFWARLFGAKKEKAAEPKREPRPTAAKSVDDARKPTPSLPKNTSVVVVYLISNRVFEETFGSAKASDFAPFEVSASGRPVKVGVSMQMRVTNYDTFRRQYLVDANEVTVESICRMMTPWVRQILDHEFADIAVHDGRLNAQQQAGLKNALGSLLQQRLYGISIINMFDLSTTDSEFERLRERQRQLDEAQKDSEMYLRETEFRNRMADLEAQQDLEQTGRDNANYLSREELQMKFEKGIAELNRDKLLSEDELKRFMAEHEMAERLADAALNADEQTRRYESEKILDQLAATKMIDADERKKIEERVAAGQFERGQLNDLLRHKALVDNTLGKLRLDTDLAMAQSKSAHMADVASLQQEAERTDLESVLYGKRYAIDRMKVEQELEIKSIKLDADLDTRRKEDAYAEEKYQLDRKHEQDEWEAKFMREGREMDRSLDMEVRRSEHDFDLQSRKATFDFDLEAKKATLDFDFEERRADKDVERTIRLADAEQAAADRQHQRDMDVRRQQQDELRMKGDIAMRNMQMMMEAKRAAKKDELDAATDQLNIKSQMTAEQLAAEQLAKLDASAQSGFMEAMKEKSSSAKEAEFARREAEMTRQMHEQMMGRADSMHEQNRNDLKEMMAQMMQMQQMNQQQAMDLARHSMDTSASIASAQAASNASAAERRAADLERDNERYREDARHSQERVDSNQTQSLNYATRITETDMRTSQPVQVAATSQAAHEEVATVPLNTAWLRDHGFVGSFNELAGQLSSLGASISKDFDAESNPIIIVDGLPEGQVFDTLQAFGVEF